MMSIGMILLTVAAILVFFGVAQRVLDKLRMSDRTALLLIAIMFFSTLLPNITIGRVQINLGGSIIPAGICIYLIYGSGTGKEQIRSVIGSLVTAGIVYGISTLMPEEPEAIVVDPMYLYGVAGGIVAYLLGRSRRAAFICGVLGVILADIAVAFINWRNGVNQALVLGGAGIFDATMVSGILAVALAELVGEILERIARGNRRPVVSPIHHPMRSKEK